MKILIISTYFPPQNSIASLRPYSWAKHWSLAGHEVTVLTTSKRRQVNDLKFDMTMFTIVEVPVRTPFSKANSIVIKSELSNSKKNSFKTRLLSILKKGYVLFCQKTGIFNTCRYPDWHDGWAKDSINVLIKEPDEWDLVISSGGPYSTHRVGLFLKENNLTRKWIVDWRDLWTKNHLYKGLLFFHPYERYLENKFHKNADYITTVSEGLAEQLEQVTNTPVKVIYNGFDKDDFEFLFTTERKKNCKFTLAYLGSIYRGYQDPEPLFIALKELREEGKITSNQFEVMFAGSGSDVADIAKKHNVEDFYSYAGFLPREKALQIQYDADALLFLEFDNPKVKGVLTGKLFEYLYVGRQIWAIGCTNNTSAGQLIENCNAGICFGNDIEKIKYFILNVISNNNFQEYDKNFGQIEEFSRKKQATRILELLEGL